MKQIAATDVKPGMQIVISDGGTSVVTGVGVHTSFGQQMLRWSWAPALRRDGLMDCGYSGIAVDCAESHMVNVG